MPPTGRRAGTVPSTCVGGSRTVGTYAVVGGRSASATEGFGVGGGVAVSEACNFPVGRNSAYSYGFGVRSQSRRAGHRKGAALVVIRDWGKRATP